MFKITAAGLIQIQMSTLFSNVRKAYFFHILKT